MKIALFGFGTVGKGCFDILKGIDGAEVKYILDKRQIEEDTGAILTSDLDQILSDPEVDTVIELIGGMHPAYDFVVASLKAGKNVVTANKLMVSAHYNELLQLAEENKVFFRFSAAAGGGIPWLVNLQRAHRASSLSRVFGIMNGTTNFILDAMQTAGEEFDPSLKKAQELGFAEADPSSDIDGLDTRHKTCLSANIAFGVALEDEAVQTFGIRRVKKCDIDAAVGRGCSLKLLGNAYRSENGSIAAFVEPSMVPMDTPEGNIHGCDNIIAFEGTYIGKTYFIGPGAGRYPTGYAVAQDVIDIMDGTNLTYNEQKTAKGVENESLSHAYYLRTDFTDDKFYKSLKLTPWGEGFETEAVSVKEMHDFASRAIAAGKDIFFAGLAW
ncbi:MAG: homoserine dehydrogenase [Clostridia bacterium]|nr:homoserine dehydrogenase [Clostridia bacterium]